MEIPFLDCLIDIMTLTLNQVDIRILNTNTGCVLEETVAVDEHGFPLEQGDYRIAGVADPGTEIRVAFMEPAGSMTGTLFPTGSAEDTITIETPTAMSEAFSVRATLIDAANPFVLVDAQSLPSNFVQGSQEWLDTVEDIRRRGAVLMGLADSEEQAASTRGTPKIAMISPASATNGTAATTCHATPDISVLSMSMGQVHPSVQLTGAVCIAAATCLEGTVAHRHSRVARLSSLGIESRKSQPQNRDSVLATRTIMIAHRSGQIPVEVYMQNRGAPKKCVVSRTARKLFEGNVLFYT